MEGYVLNSDVLCFTQDIEDEKKVLIIEKTKKINIDEDCFKFLKKLPTFSNKPNRFFKDESFVPSSI